MAQAGLALEAMLRLANIAPLHVIALPSSQCKLLIGSEMFETCREHKKIKPLGALYFQVL